MFLRISSALGAALLAGSCGGLVSPEPEGEAIECAIGPGSEMTGACIIERSSQDAFVIHHPGGGFRRFSIQQDGTIAPADGAFAISTERAAGARVIGVGSDRYLLPSDLLEAATDE